MLVQRTELGSNWPGSRMRDGLARVLEEELGRHLRALRLIMVICAKACLCRAVSFGEAGQWLVGTNSGTQA
jgi:hypothetical protein